ncbi:MAG TPA: SDR family oxidoreductase [Dermatophilaceae bacterium]|nr:SDR family oxidoreductase [Dermatophilaceae bacterium]
MPHHRKGTVLVTGANSGIGLATSIALAKRGFHAVGSVRTRDKARAVREAAAEAGVEVRTVLLDVTDEEACERVVRRLRPYGLVNNAGYSYGGAVEDVSDAEARRLLETLTVAPMRLARLALPGMRASGGGRIVNVSSIYGLTTTPLTGWYQASKHALEGVSDALRMEVARDGIKVVLVEPGGFDTGIWEGNAAVLARHAGSRYASAYERELTLTRLGRPFLGRPEQVARVIAGAVDSRSPRARYLVGRDAQLLSLASDFAPTGIRDRVTRLTMGL